LTFDGLGEFFHDGGERHTVHDAHRAHLVGEQGL